MGLPNSAEQLICALQLSRGVCMEAVFAQLDCSCALVAQSLWVLCVVMQAIFPPSQALDRTARCRSQLPSGGSAWASMLCELFLCRLTVTAGDAGPSYPTAA